MKEEIQIPIPKISIEDFFKGDSQILIMNLKEFAQNYESIINSPRRITFYQLIFITSGSLECSIDSTRHNCSRSSLIALSKGQIQKIDFDKNVQGYIIQFSEEYINRYPEDLKWLNNLELFHPLTNSLLINLSDTECLEIETYCNTMNSEMSRQDDFAKEGILINLLKTMLLILERINRDKSQSPTSDRSEWTCFSGFRDSLEEQYRMSRSVQYYADLLNTTPKKLNEITNNFCGQSAKRMIEDRVILEAKRLLIYTDNTIKEIGHFIGFNDPTNFNKFFKKFAGITPVEFRELTKTTL